MVEIQGKFFTLIGMLMSNKPEHLEKANAYLESEIGLTHLELDPEDFYDITVWVRYLEIYQESLGGNKAEVAKSVGKRIYPTVKRTSGFPPHLKTPLDFILFEAEGFKGAHLGDNIKQRTFLKKEEGLVEVVATPPCVGYPEGLIEGVYLGIMELCGIKNGKVSLIGADTFRVEW
ncbi:hypothetical protein SAMN05421780_101462 [Flexibacter flexilis DSM 6793]|uniref:Uncharacterized protein n=1 Tax=Flexibacter flexilis DSM 6793 TaxID=927664 RepID=A0A1I1DTR5_9BACT|nr:hypothetical protein [Flexibacter flexilis]SFB78355.1 hypothetical protein SAMN05421780_101462 [Flexibacter flexilis DSM 6793]